MGFAAQVGWLPARSDGYGLITRVGVIGRFQGAEDSDGMLPAVRVCVSGLFDRRVAKVFPGMRWRRDRRLRADGRKKSAASNRVAMGHRRQNLTDGGDNPTSP